MNDFQYLAPTTLEEAVSLLARYQPDARVMAGGQSLIPRMRARLLAPRYIIGLEAIPELARIDRVNGCLRVGATVTYRELCATLLVSRGTPLLAEAAGLVGSPQVRNLGTLAGNICQNDPGADPPPALLALEATAVIVGAGGERRLPLEEFFKGYNETALTGPELLRCIEVPLEGREIAWAYVKFGWRAIGRAIVGVAVALDIRGGICREARIAIGGVGPVPFRARATERLLVGRDPAGLLGEAGLAAMAEPQVDPQSDAYASADYRRKMVGVFTRRALSSAVARQSSRTQPALE